MRLSTHHKRGLGKKYVNNPELWHKTEEMVRRVMKDNNVPFVEVPDEAAFYGPKIDVQIWSATSREWTIATNQVDFAQPASFNLTYVDRHGQEQMPLCIHRAPLGTHERMIGFLIEHYAGAFPVWLAPEHARVIPITDDHNAYAEQVVASLREAGIRASADLGSDRMNNKIRQAQLMKVPYMLVVGDQEVQNGTVALRRRDGSRHNDLPLNAFIQDVQARIASRFRDL
jgi:threonyl-tRNA synthetase